MFEDIGINADLLKLYEAQDAAEEIVPCVNDPESWYPEHGGQGGTAHIKAMCRSCPIVNQCAEYGIVNEPNFGIWGGLAVRERQRIRRRRGYRD